MGERIGSMAMLAGIAALAESMGATVSRGKSGFMASGDTSPFQHFDDIPKQLSETDYSAIHAAALKRDRKAAKRLATTTGEGE